MRYRRMPIEIESPEELGHDTIDANLAESSFRDQRLSDLDVEVDVDELLLAYGTEELQRGFAALSEAASRSVRGSAPPWSTSSRTPGDRRRRRSRPRR